MKRLFLIPARGGSKGIPDKNIRELGGRPLIYYTLDAVSAYKDGTDEIFVSTDSEKIRKVVEEYGFKVPQLRPPELATDHASTESVIVYSLEHFLARNVTFDVVVILQPTSPLRTQIHIKEAIELFDDSVDMVVSVMESKANPYYNLFEEDSNGHLRKSKGGQFTRRQDAPKVYEYNGAIYVIKVDSLLKKGIKNFDSIKKYLMLPEDSIDIDTIIDWELCENLIRK
jgi:CMP-N,N'-diacetyllegionaminic acid synthase